MLSTQAWFQPTPKKGIWGRYSSLVKLPIEYVTHPECNKTHATKMGEKHQAILQAIFSRSPQNSNVCKATSATKQQGNNNMIPNQHHQINSNTQSNLMYHALTCKGFNKNKDNSP